MCPGSGRPGLRDHDDPESVEKDFEKCRAGRQVSREDFPARRAPRAQGEERPEIPYGELAPLEVFATTAHVLALRAATRTDPSADAGPGVAPDGRANLSGEERPRSRGE